VSQGRASMALLLSSLLLNFGKFKEIKVSA
jgi:hypothetical protein